MQEQQWNNQSTLTDDVGLDTFTKALQRTQNKLVALHKPGSRIKHSDGREYEVDKNGCWRRVGG